MNFGTKNISVILKYEVAIESTTEDGWYIENHMSAHKLEVAACWSKGRFIWEIIIISILSVDMFTGNVYYSTESIFYYYAKNV